MRHRKPKFSTTLSPIIPASVTNSVQTAGNARMSTPTLRKPPHPNS